MQPPLTFDLVISKEFFQKWHPTKPKNASNPLFFQVSFNEEVETFVLPSKRSLKGKKRRKKKNGSNSASESSDDASSPSPNS